MNGELERWKGNNLTALSREPMKDGETAKNFSHIPCTSANTQTGYLLKGN
jgi:hypothetical protein